MSSNSNSTNKGREPRRIAMACTICRARKLKCRPSNMMPDLCQRCVDSGSICRYIPVTATSDIPDAYYPPRGPSDLGYSPGNVPSNSTPYLSGTEATPISSGPSQQPVYWPAQSGGGTDNERWNQYQYAQPEAASSFRQHVRYSQQAPAIPPSAPAEYTAYPAPNMGAWPSHPTYYTGVSQGSSANVVPGNGPTLGNYAGPYLVQYSEDHAAYPSTWAGPANEYQPYEDANSVDATGNYYPNHYGSQSDGAPETKE